jgi:hypothetical protein
MNTKPLSKAATTAAAAKEKAVVGAEKNYSSSLKREVGYTHNYTFPSQYT